ncbi:Predicted O-methyltransferase [Weissella viridescens]|uniref:Predicted O-methyltransferase n=1 Tax=Weissella viridescens TaxID=1629 RepID=A0A380P3F8_WEIVI|nr:Predicted O-methyltransferase [Weissella viridescens]
MLANFANPRKNGRGLTVDLGSGNGAIPLFMAHKVQGQIVGVEIQPELAEMARRSVAMNQLEDKITIKTKICGISLVIFVREVPIQLSQIRLTLQSIPKRR